MQVKVSSILYSIGIAVLLAGFAVLYVLSSKTVAERSCVEMRVEYGDNGKFVNAEDVRNAIEINYGEFLTRRLDSLNVHEIKLAVEKEDAIKNCEAWISDMGTLNLHIYQRQPVVRFQNGENGFYADKDGVTFPLQARHTEKVMIVDGRLPQDNQEWIDNTIRLVEYIGESRIWNGVIIQIHVEKNGDMVLIPGSGKERFIIGKPDKIEDKFSRMEKYYRSIAPLGKNYTTINLKYADQIICK